MLNLKTNLRNFLSETAELLRNNHNFMYYDTRSTEDLKILRNFCQSKVNCIGFAGGGDRMPLWTFGAFWSTVIVTLKTINSFQSNRHAKSIATCRTQFYGKKLRMLSRWICEYPPLFNPLLLSYETYVSMPYRAPFRAAGLRAGSVAPRPGVQ